MPKAHATSVTIIDAEQIMLRNLRRDYEFRSFWLPEQPVETRHTSPDQLVLCLIEHLDAPHSDRNRSGYEVALLGPSGRTSLYAIPQTVQWNAVLRRCWHEGVELAQWSPRDMPHEVVDARCIVNPDRVDPWNPTTW